MSLSTLVRVILGLVILGVVLWAVESLIPLDPMITRMIQIVVVVGGLLYLVSFLGYFDRKV